MQLISLVHRMEQTAVAQLRKAGSPITDSQLAVLSAVKRAPGSNQTMLVAATGVDRSTLADVMRRLLKAGYISRQRTKEDARAYAVKITPTGEAVLATALKAGKVAERELLRAYPFLNQAAAE